MKVALTGVTGHLGMAVLYALQARGYSVKALVRNPAHTSSIPAQLVIGDILNPASLIPFMADCDALIHCAAMISIDGDPAGQVSKTNVDGTKHILDAARTSGIKRVIHVSSVHVYDQLPINEELDERRALVGPKGTAYDLSKKRGQEIALAMNGTSTEVIVLNPTGILGPYDYKPSRGGKMIIELVTGRQSFTVRGGFDFCDSRDVADAAVNALTMGTPGACYLLCNRWYSLLEIATKLSEVSGIQMHLINLPLSVAKAGLPFIRSYAWLRHRQPIYTREALITIATGNRHVSSVKAQRDLNYVARPLENTLADTYCWFRDNGYLSGLKSRPKSAAGS